MDLDTHKTIGLESEAEFEASLIADEQATVATASDTDVPAPAPAVEPRAHAAAPIPAAPPAPGEPTAPAQPPWTGKRLSHFKLLRLLGEGTMGRVILAQDVNLKRLVALKVLRRRIQGMDDTQRVSQFLREARAAALIEHPNVIHIYEINQHDGWWYIAMELCEGGTLQSVVKTAGPQPRARVCPLIADAATALAVVHEAGIIHRDIKPSNLMLTRTGRCKVTDFGLVRLDDPADPFDFTDKSVGTPHYMAPEVVLHRPITPAIDVYSLGGTLYYALTGSPPFVGASVKDLLKQQVNSPPPDVRGKLPDCPGSLARLIQRSLAKDPAQRPSAADFATALRAESIATGPEAGTIAALTAGRTWPSVGSTLGTSAPGIGAPPGTPAAGAGSSVVLEPEGPAGSSMRDLASTPGSVVVVTTTASSGRSAWPWALAGAAVIALVFGILVLTGSFMPGRPTRDTSSPPSDLDDAPDAVRAAAMAKTLAQTFNAAPDTYGLLPRGASPGASAPATQAAATTPSFTWRGRIDPGDARFVAGKRGLHYYPIDSPQAALISADDFVGYRSDADAQADGKTPAP